MKIAILTYNNKHNYGAELQAYALQQTLKSMGHDALHVCTSINKKPNTLRGKVREYLNQNSDRLYDIFMTDRLGFFEGCYNEETIGKLNEYFDVFISGSDQVWNVNNGVDPIFFQQFVHEDKLKISYAASIGMNTIPEIYADEVFRSLAGFDYISVREKSAVTELSKFTQKNISCNIDPVFLLSTDDWDKMLGDRIETSPYIFVYGTQMTRELKAVANELKKKTGLKLVSVFRMHGAVSIVGNSGPLEFINYVKYAEYVITTSFHCTAFSIMYHKRLIEILHSTTGSRARNLLELLDQTSSIYNPNFNFDKQWDYANTDSLIKKYRSEAMDYLHKSLNNGKNMQMGSKTIVDARKLRIESLMDTNDVIDWPNIYCTGCEMCVNICPKGAIKMNFAENGFYYPVITKDACIGCGLCHKCCPAVYKTTSEVQKQMPNKRIYALRSSDKAICTNSSSGGAFVHLSNIILNENGAVYGTRWNSKFEAVCGRAETFEQRNEFCGAKYVQSQMGNSYKLVEKDLQDGRKVLFSGLPCQVNALKVYLEIRKIDISNLFTVDLICHGCPSPSLWQEHIGDLKRKFRSNIKNVTFRAKDEIGNAQALCIEFENGKKYFARSGHDDYYRLFLQNVILRPSCFSCRFSNEDRQGDITLGDWWGGKNEA